MPSEYSPFDKDIKDLQPEDLSVLRSVHEGWYVEYKREAITASATAKALSAFANTYGGWLFVGVDEAGNGTSVAGDFAGIPQQSVQNVLQQIRQAASSSLNPAPYFRTKVVTGPCQTINLASGKSIIVVQIPSSHSAPHIHKDGRIYRRVADGSEPKPETDRFVLDQLWRRGDDIRKATRKWIRRDPEFSNEEADNPYLRLLLCVDPWQQQDPWLEAPLSDISSVFHGNGDGFATMPFETVYLSSRGIVARQLGENDPYRLGLTWKMRRDLSCEVLLPLPLHDVGSPQILREALGKYEHIEKFLQLLSSQGSGYSSPKVVDLNLVLQTHTAIASMYGQLLALVTDSREFYFKARLLNCWRTIPFVDVLQVLNTFETHGVPMVLENTLTSPDGYDPDTFAHIAPPSVSDAMRWDYKASIVQGVCAFMRTAMAFGIPIQLGNDIGEDDAQLYQDYFDAGNRAKGNARGVGKFGIPIV